MAERTYLCDAAGLRLIVYASCEKDARAAAFATFKEAGHRITKMRITEVEE